MNKFAKGVLTAAGCFLAGGVVLGIIGAAGRVYTGEPTIMEDDLEIMRDTWNKVRGWDLRWRRGGAVKGLTLEYNGIEFDRNHKDNIAYGSFTDESLRGTDIYNLDVEIGNGTLVLCQGDGLELKKEGGPECQYYIEGDTFYLKQKSAVGGGETFLTLTLPEGIRLDKADIELAAGEVITRDVLAAGEIEIEIAAGELTMEEVQADSFSAAVAAGNMVVQKLDAKDCDAEVNTGSITLENSLITGRLDAEVNMGGIDIFLRDFYEDHDYEINCGMGDITISTRDGSLKEYAGFGNTMELYGRNSGGNSTYDLDCNMGSIYVSFVGRDSTQGTVGEADLSEDSGEEMKRGEDGRPEAPETPESPETPEAPESPEAPETLESPENPELPEVSGIYDIVNEWPDRIGRENENTTAEDFSFEIKVAEQTALVISCVTEHGELDLEIEDEHGKEIFDKGDIRTGEYEVKIKSPGIYRVHFDCEDHTGSFWISPKE